MSEIASFIASSFARAVWSGRIWTDVPGVPGAARETALALRAASSDEAARLVEAHVMPALTPAARRAIEALAASPAPASAEVGEAVWEAILASAYQAGVRRLQKAAMTRLRKQAKAAAALED